MIDLIEWREPTAEFPQPSPTRVPRVIAFRTHNVTAAHRALAMQGVKFTTHRAGFSRGVLGAENEAL